MSLRQVVGLAVLGGAGWLLLRRSATTLPGTLLNPPTAFLGPLTAIFDFPALTASTPPPASTSTGRGGQVEAYLRAAGLPAHVAKGATAGAYAESRLDPNAVNPTSGAYGIGQWLGSRKAELFRRYGTRPSLAQQLEFLAWELKGGDHGGAAVLASTSAAGALDAYIRRFMRPAPGAETAGDLARGTRYLG